MSGFENMDVSQVVQSISSLGFTVWFCWHTTTITIPRLAKEGKETTKDLTDKHDATVRKLVEDFRTDLRDERQLFMAQVAIGNATQDRMCDAITELRQTISDVHSNRSTA